MMHECCILQNPLAADMRLYVYYLVLYKDDLVRECNSKKCLTIHADGNKMREAGEGPDDE
jgi:hypothetical protein